MTQIVFDPERADAAWAGVEIDGAWRSADGGRRWERVKTLAPGLMDSGRAILIDLVSKTVRDSLHI